MPLFGTKAKHQPEPLNIPTQDEAQASSVRQMSGYKNIEDVKKDAPTSDEAPASSRGQRQTSAAQTQRTSRAQVTAQAEKDRAKAERQQRAMEIIGKQLMDGLAGVPYEIWAFWLSDPALALKEEEQKELADAYYMLAQAFEPDFSKPIYLVPILALMNLRFTGRRFAYLAIKKHTGREIPPNEVEQVLKDELGIGKKPQ